MNDLEQEPLYRAALEGELSLSKEGIWVHEGRAIAHKRLAEYFHKRLRFDSSENRFMLFIGKGKASFALEDCALFVREISTNEAPWQMRLNTGATESFRLDTLSTKQDALYCRNSDGHRVKIIKPAFYTVAEYIVDDSQLEVAGQRYSIEQESD